jgi:hypothetical protein
VTELELVPRAALDASSGDWRLRATYAARLYNPDAFSSSGLDPTERANLMNFAALRVGRALRTLSLDASADVAYGYTDLLAGGVWLPAAVSTTSRLLYVSASGGLALTARPSPRTTLTADAGVFHSGGADDEARQVLPRQRGVTAGATAERRLTPRDALSLAVRGSSARFDDGLVSSVLGVSASWRHQVTPALATSVAGGVSATVSRVPGGESDVLPAPSAELGATYSAGPARPTHALRLRVDPVIDRLTGGVALRVEGSLESGWAFSPRWRLGASARVADLRALDGATGSAAIAASTGGALAARVARSMGRGLSMAGGLYGHGQRADSPDLPTFLEWGAFVALTGTTRRD